MARFSAVILSGAGLLVVSAFVVAACGSRPEPTPQPGYAPTATVKDIMDAVIDPSADVVWNSVKSITTQGSGIEEVAPRNDQEWSDTRFGALRVIEGANLLMMPGRKVARPGEKSETPGVELEPEQIEARIAEDRETWNRLAKALQDNTLVALRAIEARNPQAIFDAGGAIDTACENCHEHYWYPNQPLPPGYRSDK